MSRFGQFSHLWVEMAERLGLNVECIDVPWGGGVPVDDYARILAADTRHEIRAVFVTHNETATGVTSDVAAVRRVMDGCGHNALLFVDGVSSIGSVDFRMDDWRVDLAVTGSQKGLMLPAGLGILAVSEKAIEASRTATSRRAYFEFKDMLTLNETGYFPYTPPTQLFHGLRKSLDRIFALDFEDGSLDLLATAPIPLEGVVAVKALAPCLVTGLPLTLLSPVLAVLLNLPGPGYVWLVLSLALGTPALSLIGAFGAALTVGLKRGGLLLSLLVLPLYMPTLIFGAEVVRRGAEGMVTGTPLALLAGITLGSVAALPFAAAAALRINLR
jgi:heme exporter protein CcmB